MIACRALGHRYRFTSEGPVMRWECRRGCGEAHSKRYESADLAAMYAAAFSVEDRDRLGERAPLLGMFPLRIWHALRRRSAAG